MTDMHPLSAEPIETNRPPASRGYRALDLSAFANAAPDVLANPDAPLGRTRFHGLPFMIGCDDPSSPGVVTFGAGTPQPSPLTIPVGAAARWLVFAHSMLHTRI